MHIGGNRVKEAVRFDYRPIYTPSRMAIAFVKLHLDYKKVPIRFFPIGTRKHIQAYAPRYS
jgi:hypothetical protein